jgi:hypothetical protein
MKKTVVILALAMISFANAQKGTYLVSGSIGFNSQKVNSAGNHTDQTSFSITPKIGYQFTENWTVGAQTGVSFSKNETDAGDGKYNSYSIGTFVRYSKPVSEIFELYADFVAGYGFTNASSSNNNNLTADSNKSNGFGVGIAPALLLKIKNGFGLNFGFGGLGYSSNKSTSENNSNASQKIQSFYFNFGQSFNIGISKNF